MKLSAAAVLAMLTLPAPTHATDILRFPNTKGTVVFNHEKHERLVLKDCTVCHERPGEVVGFGREWAHRVCIGCHEPEPGKAEGPIVCEGCHTKE